jgi:uncharacterized phage protein gp47/JayE
MPNQITAAGLEIKTYQELLDFLQAAFRTIYGPDINLASDTPDGQLIGILIQLILDQGDLLVQINSSFDPDEAIGRLLDARAAINGIQRQSGTYTLTNVTIVTSQSVTLYGLDQADKEPFTVQDSSGNKFLLVDTVSLAAGTFSKEFRASSIGAILTVPNTITIPVSIILGVTSVNNPTTYTSLGIDEESDAQFRLRRMQSVALSSQGYQQSLRAALLNITGVSSAFVYENDTGSTDGDGIAGHSIWVIVGGSASSSDIANAIYRKRNAGCGMKGAQTFNIVQIDGNLLTIKWDVVEDETAFIKFNASSIDGVTPPNIALIRSEIIADYVLGVNEKANVNALASKVQAIDSNTLVTSAGFSTSLGGSYTTTLSPSAKNKQIRFTEDNTIILPIILNPPTSSVGASSTVQFSALGGYGSYTYTIDVNNSGGSINSSTGLYTSGTTTGVTDTVKVTDGDSNTATATVDVTP